jgi:TRAP-type C4-dicarboxylate transport system substrate-binding protein
MKTQLMATALATLMAVSPAFAETLKMSHVRPQDATIDVELRAFAADLSAATDGGVEIKLFPA